MAEYTIDKIKYGSNTFKLQDNVSGYTDNEGTVTSVGVSNATDGGLSVSGSPITSSGTITIGHSNVLTSAQTTQAVYPIKIDKNGHISAYGSAVTIPTAATSNPLMDGTAAVGSSAKYAKEDHVHPSDTSKVDITVTSGTTTSSIEGTGTHSYMEVNDALNGFYSGLYLSSSSASLEVAYDEGDVYNSINLTPNSTTIHNVVTPTSNGDAANKQYVDNQVSTKQATLVSGTNIKTINNNSILGSGNLSIIEGLAPLIGTTSTVTPSQVKTALLEGRDICIAATAVLDDLPLALNFTSWNHAVDSFTGEILEVVVSQTIAADYSNNYHLFELVGDIVHDELWGVVQAGLIADGQNISRLNNDAGYLTSSTGVTSVNGSSGAVTVQPTLVSGTNIKTINNQSLLGSGNISISGGGGTATDVQINGTSIVSNNVANIITNTAYNSSTNKIATMNDLPILTFTPNDSERNLTISWQSVSVVTNGNEVSY